MQLESQRVWRQTGFESVFYRIEDQARSGEPLRPVCEHAGCRCGVTQSHDRQGQRRESRAAMPGAVLLLLFHGRQTRKASATLATAGRPRNRRREVCGGYCQERAAWRRAGQGALGICAVRSWERVEQGSWRSASSRASSWEGCMRGQSGQTRKELFPSGMLGGWLSIVI